MKFVTLVLGFLVLGNLQAADFLNVRCASASGYYGKFQIANTSEMNGGKVTIKDGLELNPTQLLKDLKIISQNAFIGNLAITLPEESCVRDSHDPFVGTCRAKDVVLNLLELNQTTPVKVDAVQVSVARVDGGENLRFTFSVTHTVDGQKVKSSTAQTFKLQSGIDSCAAY